MKPKRVGGQQPIVPPKSVSSKKKSLSQQAQKINPIAQSIISDPVTNPRPAKPLLNTQINTNPKKTKEEQSRINPLLKKATEI